MSPTDNLLKPLTEDELKRIGYCLKGYVLQKPFEQNISRIIENEKIVKGIENLLDEQTNATECEDGNYFILSIVRILKEARNIPLDHTDIDAQRSRS